MESVNIWSEIGDTFVELFANILNWTSESIRTHAPGVLVAMLTLLLAWFVAALLRNATAKLLRALGVDVVAERSGLRGWLKRHDIATAPSAMLGWALYGVMVFSGLILAFERMQLESAAHLLYRVAAFVPKLLVVLVLLGLGMLLARWIGAMVGRAARLAGVPMHTLLGTAARVGVTLIAVFAALDYLHLASREVLLAGLGVVTAASLVIALLLSVCARSLVGDLLARNFVLADYQKGDRIRIGEVDGEVEAVGTTAVRIRNHEGSYLVPNAKLLQEIVLRRQGSDPMEKSADQAREANSDN